MFTEEQLQELESIFNLKRATDVLEVRDGFIAKGKMLWWRNALGPEKVASDQHWDNIKEFPEVYSIHEPKTSVIYLD